MAPLLHYEVHEIPQIHRRLFAEHVVVLINVKDKRRSSDDAFAYSRLPAFYDLVVMVHDKVHGSPRTFEDLVEPSQGVLEQAEIVEINVHNERHACP